MGSFTTFENSGETFDYLLTNNHLILLFIGLVIIIFFSMYAARQKPRFQRWFVFGVGLFILVLEGLRIFWRYRYVLYNNESLDLINLTQLDFFTLSLWISLPLIIFSPLVRKHRPYKVFGLEFVFRVTTIFGIISLIYPININTGYNFYHCYNLMYLLIRSLTVMLGIFFAISKWISVERFADHWKSILMLLLFGGICYAIWYFAFPTTNLFYASSFGLFEAVGIYLPSPLHIVGMEMLFFVFQILLCAPFRLVHAIKNRN